MDSNFQYAGAVSLGCRPLFSRPVAWTGRCGRSGVSRFRAFVRRVAETVDGHPEPRVDCLAELMCQTRAGESGSWFGIAPNEVKALATALAIRSPIGMIAPSTGALDAERVAR
jgi:hypothetical protein